MGPLFDNLGSQWHVATVKTGSLTGSACKNQVLLRSWTNNVSDNFNINVRMLQNNVLIVKIMSKWNGMEWGPTFFKMGTKWGLDFE